MVASADLTGPFAAQASGPTFLSDFMVDPSPALHIYDREIDSRERTSLSVLTSHIRPGARVLDLGCGSGAIGRYLAQRDGAGTTVIDGLTISADEAALAAPHYRRVEVADLDAVQLIDLFPAGGYDAIVCADVLEHVRQSERVLVECRQLLAPGGQVLLSIPNAAYCGLIAELMAGEFRYRPEGLLDETHVRFFTRQTLLRFLQAGGWAPRHIETIERALPASEFRMAFDALPPAVARHLLALPDAMTYQFIVVAQPLAGPVAGVSFVQAIEAAPPLPAQALFTAQLYTGADGAYSEADKITAAGVIGQVGKQAVQPLAKPAHLLFGHRRPSLSFVVCQKFPRQFHVRLAALAVRLIEVDRHTEARGLAQAHGARNDGAVDLVAKVLFDLRDDLHRQVEPPGVHREQHALDV